MAKKTKNRPKAKTKAAPAVEAEPVDSPAEDEPSEDESPDDPLLETPADEPEPEPPFEAVLRSSKLSLPVSTVDPGAYCKRSFKIRLKPHQARALKGLVAGLIAKGTKMADGGPVKDSRTAIKYLLEQI